jgi:hypothetical protein
MKKKKLNSNNPKYKTINPDKDVKPVRTIESKCAVRNASGNIVPNTFAKVTAVWYE